MQYKSTGGNAPIVDFETAILDGYAPDGGLYVPTEIPKITPVHLEQWRNLEYISLAFEILSLFIDRSVISEPELKGILAKAYSTFEKEDVIPICTLDSLKNTYIMELFYGPTLSFKDVGMSFLVHLVNFFLERKKQHLSVIVATTGDTGPAAANFIAGLSNMDAWILYPKGKITDAQERQMTTIVNPNVHAVGVANCPEGGDDLDVVITKLYANKKFKDKLNLSSVNSINWGRIMMQTVHYFYGYFKVTDHIGEEINVSVPSGGFGNLCAGGLARIMGLPIKTCIAATNRNDCLNRLFSKGVFSKKELYQTHSSAIDILYPINFWRYLYFSGVDIKAIGQFMEEYGNTGYIKFDSRTYRTYSSGFLAHRVSDRETLQTIHNIYTTNDYLLDPHGAVALNAGITLERELGSNKLLCLATAHPAKFPEIIKKALDTKEVPNEARHDAIASAKAAKERGYLLEYSSLEVSLLKIMETNWEATKKDRL